MALGARGRSFPFSRRSRHTSGTNWSKVSWAAPRGLARWPSHADARRSCSCRGPRVALRRRPGFARQEAPSQRALREEGGLHEAGPPRLSAALMSPGSQDGLHRLEPCGAIAAESDSCLCTVEKARIHIQRQMGGAEVQDDLSGQLLLTRRPRTENVCIRASMRCRLRMSARARATPRRWALSSLQAAELLCVLAVGVAARCPLPQPAATNAGRATASARAPATGSR